ncbi:MAG: alkaline phosphatase D family protein, partial [Nocardioides sp.]
MNETSTSVLPRRTVLATGAVGTAATLGVLATEPAQARRGKKKGKGGSKAKHPVFQHGVASGDPLPHAVVLWTRVTPTPTATPGSGRGGKVTVRWEVASDKRFRRVVSRGRFVTSRGRDHTVKLDAKGLKPERWYYYRFHALGQTSPVGRTRTAPAEDATPENLRIGFTSCSNWPAGLFA